MAKTKKPDALAKVKAVLRKNPDAKSSTIARQLKMKLPTVYGIIKRARKEVEEEGTPAPVTKKPKIESSMMNIALEVPSAGLNLKVRSKDGLISTLIITNNGVRLGTANSKNIENRNEVEWAKLEALSTIL